MGIRHIRVVHFLGLLHILWYPTPVTNKGNKIMNERWMLHVLPSDFYNYIEVVIVVSYFQFSVVTTLHTTLLDVFPNTLRHGKRPMLVMLTICLIGYLLGLTCCTRVSTVTPP